MAVDISGCPQPALCTSVIDGGSGSVGLAFGLTVAAGLSTTIGAALPLLPCVDETKTQYLSMGLGVSSGVMLYISFAEILPEASDYFCCHTGSAKGPAAHHGLGVLCFFLGALGTWGLHHVSHAVAAAGKKAAQHVRRWASGRTGGGAVGSGVGRRRASVPTTAAADTATARGTAAAAGDDGQDSAAAVQGRRASSYAQGGAVMGHGPGPSGARRVSSTSSSSSPDAAAGGAGATATASAISPHRSPKQRQVHRDPNSASSQAGGTDVEAGLHTAEGALDRSLAVADRSCGEEDEERRHGGQQEPGSADRSTDAEAEAGESPVMGELELQASLPAAVRMAAAAHGHHGQGQGHWQSSSPPPRHGEAALPTDSERAELVVRHGHGQGQEGDGAHGSGSGFSSLTAIRRASAAVGGGVSVAAGHGSDGAKEAGNATRRPSLATLTLGHPSGSGAAVAAAGTGSSHPSITSSSGTSTAVSAGSTAASIGHEEKARLKSMGVLTGAAIFVHNFPEGMVTFIGALSSPRLGYALALAVALHNIPEGIAAAAPIYYATGNRRLAFWWGFVSGVSEPIGALIGWLALKSLFSPVAFGAIFGLVAGMMVYIVVREALPTAHRYDPSDVYTTASVFFGMAVMAASLLLFDL